MSSYDKDHLYEHNNMMSNETYKYDLIDGSRVGINDTNGFLYLYKTENLNVTNVEKLTTIVSTFIRNKLKYSDIWKVESNVPNETIFDRAKNIENKDYSELNKEDLISTIVKRLINSNNIIYVYCNRHYTIIRTYILTDYYCIENTTLRDFQFYITKKDFHDCLSVSDLNKTIIDILNELKIYLLFDLSKIVVKYLC